MLKLGKSGHSGRKGMVTLIRWQDRFGTEEACHEYLYQQR